MKINTRFCQHCNNLVAEEICKACSEQGNKEAKAGGWWYHDLDINTYACEAHVSEVKNPFTYTTFGGIVLKSDKPIYYSEYDSGERYRSTVVGLKPWTYVPHQFEDNDGFDDGFKLEAKCRLIELIDFGPREGTDFSFGLNSKETKVYPAYGHIHAFTGGQPDREGYPVRWNGCRHSFFNRDECKCPEFTFEQEWEAALKWLAEEDAPSDHTYADMLDIWNESK